MNDDRIMSFVGAAVLGLLIIMLGMAILASWQRGGSLDDLSASDIERAVKNG